MMIIDGHCDTLSKALDNKINLDSDLLSFNIKQALPMVPMLQTGAIFVNPDYKNSFERACNIISYFEKQKEKYANKIIQIKCKDDITKMMQEKKVGILLTIENARAIENNLENVDYFYQKGVRVMSVTWNEDNLLGCGALTKNDNGLTDFGKQYIYKLDENKIITDISHSSEKTFWDVIDLTEKVVATHSCAYSLCNHPRNLKDEQIKQIAKTGGIIGVCYCAKFLSETGIASTKDIVKHIAYISNLVGIEHVGLGSDFDGIEGDEIPTNLKRIGEIQNLIEELQKAGFYKDEIEKIMGRNWKLVLEKYL